VSGSPSRYAFEEHLDGSVRIRATLEGEQFDVLFTPGVDFFGPMGVGGSIGCGPDNPGIGPAVSGPPYEATGRGFGVEIGEVYRATSALQPTLCPLDPIRRP